jgi:hypothetical protein
MTTIHTTTTIHKATQQQLHTRQPKTGKVTHETILESTCAKGKNTQVIQLLHIANCDCFLFIYQSLIHSRFRPSPSLLIPYYTYRPSNYTYRPS